MHNVPALRSVMSQVIRWLIPSPESTTSRNAIALEVVDVLGHWFFEVKGFERPEASAEELVNLVAESIFEDIQSFSPKMTPSFDSYPTVATKNPTSGKTSTTTLEEYVTRFRTNMAWHSLAKSVARFVSYKLEEGFMKAFNNPNYVIYVMEDTKIPGDVLKGLISLSSHGEIMGNPFLRSNRPLQAKIEEDFRKSVILAVDEELTERVAETQEYDKLSIKDRDKVAKDQQKFSALAQGYKSALGKHNRGDEVR